MVAGHLRVQSGYWQMIFSYKDVSGKRKTKSVSTKLKQKGNKKRAEQMLLEARQKFDFLYPGLRAESGGVTFSEYMLEWLSQMKSTVAPTTFSSYSHVVKNSICPYFQEKGILLAELKPRDISAYYDLLLNRGLSTSTVLRHHANIRKALQKAVVSELIAYNPADRVQRPRNATYMASYYSIEEAAELLRCASGTELEIPVALALFYGLRRSEILGLRWENIDFDNRLIHIVHSVNQISIEGERQVVERDILKRKSSYRTLPLSEFILPLLEAHKEKCGYVCVDETGNLLKPDTLSRRFGALLEKHGLRRIRFHDCRHSCSGFLLSAQVPLIEVQQWLGHSNISTTADLYSHLDFSMKLRSADILNKLFLNISKEKTHEHL